MSIGGGLNWAFSGGNSRSKTKVEMPPPSPDEQELTKLNLLLAKQQASQLRQQQFIQDYGQPFDEAAYLAKYPDAAEAIRQGAFPDALSHFLAARAAPGDNRAPMLKPLTEDEQLTANIEKKAKQNVYARLTGQAPVLSPEEQARLDEIYGATKTQGEADLKRFAQEMASARGMTTADSPIGGEALRQARDFGVQLNAAKSAAALDLGQANAAFNQGLMDFRTRLAQQSLMNRLALSSAQPGSYGLSNSLFSQRLGQAAKTNTGETYNWGWGGQVQAKGGMGGMGMG